MLAPLFFTSAWILFEGIRVGYAQGTEDPIVGGHDTTIEDHPYQLSLQYRGSHICGASIISRTVALTAAHCVYKQPARKFSVRVGSTFRERGGRVVRVKRIRCHKKYSDKNVDYDVAVLHLASKLRLNARTSLIQLIPSGTELRPGVLGTVTGWGTLKENVQSLPLVLQEVSVPIWSAADCARANDAVGKVTERMVCAGYTDGGMDSCEGDSGGPLVSGGKQVGIVSWGKGCARPRYPGVYTKISNSEVHAFIEREMKKRRRWGRSWKTVRTSLVLLMAASLINNYRYYRQWVKKSNVP